MREMVVFLATLPLFGAYQAQVTSVTCGAVAGWALDSNNPAAILSLDIYDHGMSVATVQANQSGHGGHAFLYSPGWTGDHVVAVRYSGYPLSTPIGSVVSLACSTPVVPITPNPPPVLPVCPPCASGVAGCQPCPPGKDGRDGKDGLNGKDGINGKDGKDGRDGTNGTGTAAPAGCTKDVLPPATQKSPCNPGDCAWSEADYKLWTGANGIAWSVCISRDTWIRVYSLRW